MNKTIELMLNRRSVRTYADKPIADDEKKAIFDCAMRAPTAGNMMLYSMIEITSQDVKDKLAVSCDNQPFIAKAPLVVLFVADFQRMFDYYRYSGAQAWSKQEGIEFTEPQEGDLLLAVNDALIAAQSAVTAAESLGIGSCYIGDIMEQFEYHKELFELPDFVFPVTLLCFGYPKTDGPKTPVPRYDEKYVHFENTYKRFGAEELLHMADRLEKWQYKGTPPEYKGGNIGIHIYARKYATEYAKEMNRSVRVALKAWSKEQ
ncbi:MAG: nitroreductase family protein [Spirochaetales bacterium]|nr:nitroreductase family protein [Spirochaetales bacterium]